MNLDKIFEDLKLIFFEVLENDKLILDEDTDLKDIQNWNSLNHVMLIDAVEKHYDIKFDLSDMLNFISVGDICRGINNKKANSQTRGN